MVLAVLILNPSPRVAKNSLKLDPFKRLKACKVEIALVPSHDPACTGFGFYFAPKENYLSLGVWGMEATRAPRVMLKRPGLGLLAHSRGGSLT